MQDFGCQEGCEEARSRYGAKSEECCNIRGVRLHVLKGLAKCDFLMVHKGGRTSQVRYHSVVQYDSGRV